MATSGMAVAQQSDQHPTPGTPVEIGADADTTPGLVVEWRTDGTRAVHQERVVVATKSAGEIEYIDVARDAVTVIDGEQARLIREVLGDHV